MLVKFFSMQGVELKSKIMIQLPATVYALPEAYQL